MKKLWILLAALSLLVCFGASADDLDCHPVEGDTPAYTPAYLDDVELGTTYEIPWYGRLTPVSFEFVDRFVQYEAGCVGQTERVGRDTGNLLRYSEPGGGLYSTYYTKIKWMLSGEDADFAYFVFDIVNLQRGEHSYMPEIKVVAVFDNQYEFGGWVRQFDNEYEVGGAVFWDETRYVMCDPAIQRGDEIPIGMLGTGHFIIGCTLPNMVVKGTEPLRLEVTIGEHFLVYNIRD